MSIFLCQPALRRLRLCLYLGMALLGLGMTLAGPAGAQAPGPIYTATIDGVLTRYSADYVRRALREAEAAAAEALVVQLSGEGAVLREARALAADLAVAQVPVVVYVGPAGTDAGAAGAWLLGAAHVAAMAPDTRFGVAAPLAEPAGAVSDQVRDLFYAEVERQLANWASARGRDAGWISQAVRSGVVLNNEQAITRNPPAIDLVARDNAELLTLLEGRVITLENGDQRTLRTLGRGADPVPPTLWELLLLTLASPTLAFLLLVMAGMAAYAEFISPTVGILAGIGVVLLIASAVGLFALPVRWISVLGLILAFGLIAADLFFPSHGAVTVIGVVLMVVSALTMFDTAQAPGVAVAIWAVVLVALVIGAFAALGIWLVIRTRSRPVTTGQEGLVGRMAEVRRRLDPEGMVFVEGALWRAVSEDGPVDPGEWVRVTGVYELRLTVRRLGEPAPAEPAG